MAEKKILETVPPYLRVWMTAPPLLSEGLDQPLYKPYRYVPPQRVRFWRRFSLKTGIDFDHF